MFAAGGAGDRARRMHAVEVLILMAVAGVVCGCDRGTEKGAPGVAAGRRRPTVASVVPAATDVLLAMGAGDHLVGCSNCEPQRAELRNVPRVGDYHTVDWERLSEIRPDVLLIPRPKAETAAAFRARADALGIRLVEVHMDRLEDIFPVIQTVGAAVGQMAKAEALEKRLRDQLDGVRKRVAGQDPVPALIVLDSEHTFLAGGGNYLDDLLRIAGGRNLAAGMGKDYPTIDTEKLISLNPAAVIQLLPEAPPQVLEQARQRWSQLPRLDAVRNGRVTVYTDWYLTLPSTHVGDVCEKLAEALHPAAASQPATKP